VRCRLIALCLVAPSLFAASIVTACGATVAVPQRASPGPDGIGIQLAGVPGGSSADPLARLYIIDRLAPGSSLTRRVEITNTTKASAYVAVYAAGATVGRGGFAFESGHSQDELSSWTSARPAQLRLAPGAAAFGTVTIEVPRSASAGNRYAVLWAQVSTVSSADGGLRLVNRVGVRMYISIGNGGAAPPSFVIGPLTAERSGTGRLLVVAEVHNTGQGILDLTGNLNLVKGPGELRAGPFAAKLGTVLASGDSEVVSVSLPEGLARGPWRAQLLIRSGLVRRSAVQTITFPPVADVSVSASGSSPLILIAIALAVLVGLSALGSRVVRHERAYRAAGRGAPSV
jgi:hypothetical protein